MPRSGGQVNRDIWNQRRDAWFAQHSTCVECGSTKELRIVWNGSGPKPFKSMTEAFRTAEPRRSTLLADCVSKCYQCWLKTYPRNTHGGGAAGIAGCKCGPCVARHNEYARNWGREKTRQWHERRDKLIDKGLPTLARRVSRTHNEWNKTDEGRKQISITRRQRREDWLAGRTCTLCGATKNLRCTWITYPGPLRSTGQIWTHGLARREEYLQKCHTLCVPCLRTTTGQMWKKEKHDGQ